MSTMVGCKSSDPQAMLDRFLGIPEPHFKNHWSRGRLLTCLSVKSY